MSANPITQTADPICDAAIETPGFHFAELAEASRMAANEEANSQTMAYSR